MPSNLRKFCVVQQPICAVTAYRTKVPAVVPDEAKSLTEIYYIASQARSKLAIEADRREHRLRQLVGHANLLDALILELDYKDTVPSKVLDISIHIDEIIAEATENDEIQESPIQVCDEDSLLELGLRRVPSRTEIRSDGNIHRRASSELSDVNRYSSKLTYEPDSLENDESNSDSDDESEFGDEVSFAEDLVCVAQRYLTHLTPLVLPDAQRTEALDGVSGWVKSPTMAAAC